MRTFLSMYATVFAATTGWGIYAIREDSWGAQGYEVSLTMTGFVVPVAAATFTLCLVQHVRPIRWLDPRADAMFSSAAAGFLSGMVAWSAAMLLTWLLSEYISTEVAAKVLPHDAIATGLCSGIAVLGAAAVLPAARPGCCVRCGYDMTSTDAGRCTECGSRGTRFVTVRRTPEKPGRLLSRPGQ